MSVVLHWFLPTQGDSRTVVPFGEGGHRRPPSLDYLTQIAEKKKLPRDQAWVSLCRVLLAANEFFYLD